MPMSHYANMPSCPCSITPKLHQTCVSSCQNSFRPVSNLPTFQYAKIPSPPSSIMCKFRRDYVASCAIAIIPYRQTPCFIMTKCHFAYIPLCKIYTSCMLRPVYISLCPCSICVTVDDVLPHHHPNVPLSYVAFTPISDFFLGI